MILSLAFLQCNKGLKSFLRFLTGKPANTLRQGRKTKGQGFRFSEFVGISKIDQTSHSSKCMSSWIRDCLGVTPLTFRFFRALPSFPSKLLVVHHHLKNVARSMGHP